MNLAKRRDAIVATRPVCPSCAVPMWLTKIYNVGNSRAYSRYHFDCVACGGKAIIPSLDDD